MNANRLIEHRQFLQKKGISTEQVDSIVFEIAAAKDTESVLALLARLEIAAKEIPWELDQDYAAAALADGSSSAVKPSVQIAMRQAALERARWCASCAMSGGEGLARSLHVRELEGLLANSTGKQ